MKWRKRKTFLESTSSRSLPMMLNIAGETPNMSFVLFVPIKYIFHIDSSRKRRTHAHSSPESKRAKTLLPEHASSTLWPRHGGTGAPSGETADAPNHNTTAGDSSPVDAQLPSSTSASKGIESDHLTGGPSVRDVEPPSSPLASDACSNSGPSSPPIHLENDPKS